MPALVVAGSVEAFWLWSDRLLQGPEFMILLLFDIELLFWLDEEDADVDDDDVVNIEELEEFVVIIVDEASAKWRIPDSPEEEEDALTALLGDACCWCW